MIKGFENILKPVQGEAPALSLSVGYFVFFEATKELKFQDSSGKFSDISRVSLLTDSDLRNETKKFPKPYRINENGEVVDNGASVLYSYMDSSTENIVVFGALKGVRAAFFDVNLTTDFEDYENLEEKGLTRDNDYRYFHVKEDAKGNLVIYLEGKNENGNVGVKIVGDESQQNGNLRVELNGKMSLKQVDDDDEMISEIYFDNKTDDEKIIVRDKHGNIISMQKDGSIIETEKIRIGKDVTLKEILTDLLDAIHKIQLNHPQAPTVKGQVMNWSDFKDVKDKIKKFMSI